MAVTAADRARVGELLGRTPRGAFAVVVRDAAGVARAEADVDRGAVALAHERYAAERDADIPNDHAGPVPAGGVGGTRSGVKCLHAHYAWFLAGGDDPVGRWVAGQLQPDGAEA
jgi:hypothetical protein